MYDLNLAPALQRSQQGGTTGLRQSVRQPQAVKTLYAQPLHCGLHLGGVWLPGVWREAGQAFLPALGALKHGCRCVCELGDGHGTAVAGGLIQNLVEQGLMGLPITGGGPAAIKQDKQITALDGGALRIKHRPRQAKNN